ncbi:aryl-alcohol dehydrogenase-like predicted oxidoreductase [Povalibacter uvarum]|uniref:Aryl-alcohol dehydrogenase-like predicted oxidoreductase n=1 Tax=Povalibacter uvarum TaxID=732238 RepID=A0A841HMW2_9GAMM|nr:aldo/keto reductase [Povalibacter uvarum]MBB6093689.1 aryl-alcohol dehydrogenase-like predicted oxidoreductase [Povalibacter uvarum]
MKKLMFGGNVLGWTADEATSFALLDDFVGAGFDAIDTADVYSRWAPGHVGGESEALIGRWLRRRGRRDDVIIATKCGMDMGDDRKGLSARWIRTAVNDSLRRLRTDYIDLYQAHQDDPATPLEETLHELAALVREGKVRAIGASNYSGARLSEALRLSRELGLPRFETLQPHYNLYERADFERDLQPVCERENLAVITYYSLASGFLTGKYRSEADFGKSPRGRRMSSFLNARGLRILGALDQVAASVGATPSQVALAWLMSRPTVAAPIVSATSLPQLREIMKSATLKLDADSLSALDRASAP